MLASLSLKILEQVWTMDAQGVKRGDRDKVGVLKSKKGVEIKALANVFISQTNCMESSGLHRAFTWNAPFLMPHGHKRCTFQAKFSAILPNKGQFHICGILIWYRKLLKYTARVIGSTGIAVIYIVLTPNGELHFTNLTNFSYQQVDRSISGRHNIVAILVSSLLWFQMGGISSEWSKCSRKILYKWTLPR